MATISDTAKKRWKVVIRKAGWLVSTKTFQIERDAKVAPSQTDDELVCGVYICRADAAQTMLKTELDRNLTGITLTTWTSTQRQEWSHTKTLIESLGKYSLAAIKPDVFGKYRHERLAGGGRHNGVLARRSTNTVRLDYTILGHLYTKAIREWRMGILNDTVTNVRKPSARAGRTLWLSRDEEEKLLAEVDQHLNPMLV